MAQSKGKFQVITEVASIKKISHDTFEQGDEISSDPKDGIFRM
jgi:hypothetical protein